MRHTLAAWREIRISDDEARPTIFKVFVRDELDTRNT